MVEFAPSVSTTFSTKSLPPVTGAWCPSGYTTQSPFQGFTSQEDLDIAVCCPRDIDSTSDSFCYSIHVTQTSNILNGPNNGAQHRLQTTFSSPGTAEAPKINIVHHRTDAWFTTSSTTETTTSANAKLPSCSTTFATLPTQTTTRKAPVSLSARATQNHTSSISDQQSLQCLRIIVPVGVLGFYSWLSDLVTLTIAVATAVKLLSEGDSLFSLPLLFEALSAASKMVFALYESIKAVDNCTNHAILADLGTSRVAKALVQLMWVRGFQAIISIIAMIAMGSGILFIIWLPGLAWLFAFFAGYGFYVPVLRFTQIFGRTDLPVLRPQIIAISVPSVVVILVGSGIGFKKHPCLGILAFVASVIVAFHLWAIGVSHLLIGEHTGDIWGAYILQNSIGKVEATLTGLVPILTAGFSAPQLLH